MPDVSIQSALRVLLNYNGLTNRFIEGSPTYITKGISDSSITSNGTIFSGTNGYLVETFGNTTLNKYYPEFKITCSGYLRDLHDITKDILYPVYSGNIKYNLSDAETFTNTCGGCPDGAFNKFSRNVALEFAVAATPSA